MGWSVAFRWHFIGNIIMVLRYDFWARVGPEDENGCWPWLRAKDADGYGVVRIGGKFFRAHRVAYELATGIIPGRLYVCHTCDNPTCCNPDHLWLGDSSENQIDAVRKGRRRGMPQRGNLNHAARLSEGQAQAIIARVAEGGTNVEIAREFGVTHANVSAIRRGVSWRHLPRADGGGAVPPGQASSGRRKY